VPYPKLIKSLLFIVCISLSSSCGETTPATSTETPATNTQPTAPSDNTDSTTPGNDSTDTNTPPDDSNNGDDNSNPGDSNNGGDNSNTGDSNNGGDNSNPGDSNNGDDNSNPDDSNTDNNGVPVYTCPEDDIYEDNDNVDTATAISPTTVYHAIACSLDGDVNHDGDLFSLRVDAGCSIEATIEFTHANGDLDMVVYTRTSGFLGEGGSSDTDNESITYTATSSDEYFISIIPYQTMGNQYALQVYLACP